MKSLDKGQNRRVAVAAFAALATLAGCSSSGNAPLPGPSVTPAPASNGVVDGPARTGAPYTIAGYTYTPVDQVDYDEAGYASWYGAELAGRPTASGEPFEPTGISAAHRTLPLPSYVEVTRLDTGRTILVRINDRGPADPDRTIDLSTGAAEQLGITELGMVPVRIRRTNPVETERAALRAGQPVAARLDTPDSLLEILRERAGRLPVPAGARAVAAVPTRPVTAAPAAGAATPASATPAATASSAPAATASSAPAAAAPVPAGAGGYLVQVAAFSSRVRADALARRLTATVVPSGNLFRVRYGPFTTAAEAQAAVARARSLGQPGAVIQRER